MNEVSGYPVKLPAQCEPDASKKPDLFFQTNYHFRNNLWKVCKPI